MRDLWKETHPCHGLNARTPCKPQVGHLGSLGRRVKTSFLKSFIPRDLVPLMFNIQWLKAFVDTKGFIVRPTAA